MTLTAIAFDAFDNRTASLGKAIRVDTILPKFTSGVTVTAAVGTLGTAAGVTVYNAIATDQPSIIEDEGITYTLGGADALTFEIDPDNGEVTYKDVQDTADITHNIMITATDTASNVATQDVTILVRNALTVDITDNIEDGKIANIEDASVTFTFDFKEAVTGFSVEDITVSGGGTPAPAVTFTETTLKQVYTLEVTPSIGTSGTISVMVAAGAVTSDTNGVVNAAVTGMQEYDLQAPNAPTFDDVVTDGILNVADQDATLMGTTEADTTITLCFGGTDADCGGDGSMIRTTGVAVGDVTVFGTTWSYTLVADDITAMDQGDRDLARHRHRCRR